MFRYPKNYPLGIEEDVQEAGRAGRDEIRAEAILFEGKTGKLCERKMRDYQSTIEICRRRCTFNCFHTKDITCDSCDVCSKLCVCEKCKL